MNSRLTSEDNELWASDEAVHADDGLEIRFRGAALGDEAIRVSSAAY